MSTTVPLHASSFSSGTTGAGGGVQQALQLQHCAYHVGASVGSSGSALNNNSINVPNNNTMGMSSAGSSNGSNLVNGQQRSTRGASKQRRDQINVEIQKLRDLLPLSDLIKDRLFQLQVMSLGCIFIRKHRYQQTVLQPQLQMLQMQMSSPMPRGIDICKALRGFMLMVTRSGKILHVSDNASEYLGHSVEEIMCQGDSIYDLVDGRDHGAVQAELASGPPGAATFPEERVFICRLNLARTAKRQLQYHKFVLFQGRYIQPAEFYQQLNAQNSQPDCDQPVFSAYCQPLINPENAEGMSTGNTHVFSTQHYLDMKFKEADTMASQHLGFSKEQLKGMSWYGMIHPNHVPEIAHKHRLLCQEKEGSVLALIRLQAANGEWIWLHTVFSIRPNNELNSDGKRLRHVIHCFHQKLTDLEAATLQANSWIYSMRHTYPTVFSCQDSPPPSEEQQPSSPQTPPFTEQPPMLVEQKPLIGAGIAPGFPSLDYNQIKVEIPMRPINTQIPLFTPESSSPESSASLHTSLLPHHNAFPLDILEDILPSNDVLPELKDEVDEILRQVEQSPATSPAHSFPSNVNFGHRHSMPNAFDSAELYKYLGPALFDGNFAMQHQHHLQQQHQSQPPHPYHFDYYNRKRSWAV
uniref:Putative transcription factor C15C8.2 n=1 Tax=Caenorhabditis elegans TaxID=6239 RepID=G5EFA5_CAEEL|nr:putative transcription factor C15C8.2 [Caenorhabditis elegans]